MRQHKGRVNIMKLLYRPEIDGLRAIAVIAVIFFHAIPSFFPNGFLGVDVFFVISGYLITNIIYEDLTNKEFSLIFFYEKRVRRIFPALLFTIFISEILAYILLMPDALESFSKSVFFALSFTSNIFFYKQTGYFDVDAELKPLLHTWSLSVEEQFYLFFPFLCIFLFKQKLLNFGASIIILFMFFLLGAYLLHGLVTKDAFFYLLQTRFWEFLAGSTVVVLREYFQKYNPQSSFQKSTLSMTGLALILFSLFGYGDFANYNFLQLIIVVLATVLFLLFSSNNDLWGKILATRYLTSIGLISFSAYLLHQPIFVFYRNINISSVNFQTYIFLIFFIFIISYFSWKYIELPFRNSLIISRRTLVFSLTALGSIILGFAIYAKYYDGLPSRYSLDDRALNYFNERNDCSSNEKKFQPCVLGDLTKSQIDFLIIGDSHSKSIMPAFNTMGNQMGLKVARLGAPGCPPLLDLYVLSGNGHDKNYCPELAKRELDFAVQNKISKVILVARWAKYFDVDSRGERAFYLGNSSFDDLNIGKSKEIFIDKFKKTIERYEELGIKVLVLEQVPEHLNDTKGVYFKLSRYENIDDKNNILEKYSVKSVDHVNANIKLLDFFNLLGVKKISLDSFFCDQNICKMGTIDEPYYKDQHHLSVVGARNLVSTLRYELSKINF